MGQPAERPRRGRVAECLFTFRLHCLKLGQSSGTAEASQRFSAGRSSITPNSASPRGLEKNIKQHAQVECLKHGS